MTSPWVAPVAHVLAGLIMATLFALLVGALGAPIWAVAMTFVLVYQTWPLYGKRI